MTLRLWTLNTVGQTTLPSALDILPGLPRGLRREDAPGYILSNTYANVLGLDLPRRGILLGLAASMAATIAPLRPARAVPILVPVAIAAVAIGAATIKVFKATWGSFEAKNDDDEQKRGYVMINVNDEKTDAIEGSITARYSFPANTIITVRFDRGPPATTKGDKILEIASDENSDTDDFEAV